MIVLSNDAGFMTGVSNGGVGNCATFSISSNSFSSGRVAVFIFSVVWIISSMFDVSIDVWSSGIGSIASPSGDKKIFPPSLLRIMAALFEPGFKFFSSTNSLKDCGLSKAFFITLLDADEKILRKTLKHPPYLFLPRSKALILDILYINLIHFFLSCSDYH